MPIVLLIINSNPALKIMEAAVKAKPPDAPGGLYE